MTLSPQGASDTFPESVAARLTCLPLYAALQSGMNTRDWHKTFSTLPHCGFDNKYDTTTRVEAYRPSGIPQAQGHRARPKKMTAFSCGCSPSSAAGSCGSLAAAQHTMLISAWRRIYAMASSPSVSYKGTQHALCRLQACTCDGRYGQLQHAVQLAPL